MPAPRLAPLRSLLRLGEARWALAAAVLFAAGAGARWAGAPAGAWWALLLAGIAAGGWAPARDGLVALRHGTLDVDLLMVVAAIGAAAIGQVLDGALLIVIFAVSGALEAGATARTEASVRGLLDLAPERACRLGADGVEESLPVADLRVGDRVLVHAGDRVPADGTVTDGRSDVDQAGITGEPLPDPKGPGDTVYAGTLNGAGALQVRVARPAGESVVARIATLVERASATKARTQLLVERIEQRWSVLVVVATLALFGVPLALGADLTTTLLRAMTFMIVASPCAVVLATMPALLAAVSAAGRRGVLVKSAPVLERLATITAVAVDKTGTLTLGRPHVRGLHPLDGPVTAPTAPGDDPASDADLVLAAGAERLAEHPVARAVVEAAHGAGLDVPGVGEIRAVVSLPGRGVRATVRGHRVEVLSPGALDGAEGRPRLDASASAVVAALAGRGGTVAVVVVDGRPRRAIVLGDRLRPDAAPTVAALAAGGAGVVLLTGDQEAAGREVADAVGIDEVRAGLLPADKVAAVEDLRAQGHRVLLLGDGVNDAPALAAADVGVAVALGGAADLSLETADAVVVTAGGAGAEGAGLAALPAVTAHARRARRVVLANLALAAGAVAGLATWDLVGHLPLPLGVAGHEGSTVLVALNGLRLLRRPRVTATPATGAAARTSLGSGVPLPQGPAHEPDGDDDEDDRSDHRGHRPGGRDERDHPEPAEERDQPDDPSAGDAVGPDGGGAHPILPTRGPLPVGPTRAPGGETVGEGGVGGLLVRGDEGEQGPLPVGETDGVGRAHR